MRTNTIFGLTCLLVTILISSCGNKKNKQDAESLNPDSTEITVQSAAPSAAVVVEEMILSLKENDICDGKPNVLTIKGGVPFADEEMAYSIKMKENNYNGHMELGKFSKNEDASFSIDVMPSINDYNIDGGTMVLTVTDANGTEKTISFGVPYLP